MTLWSIGPKDMADDEQKIGSGYKPYLLLILPLIPLVIAEFSVDLKWVIAVGFAIIIAQLGEAGGRLYDLCIRLRRTNLLLAQRSSN